VQLVNSATEINSHSPTYLVTVAFTAPFINISTTITTAAAATAAATTTIGLLLIRYYAISAF